MALTNAYATLPQLLAEVTTNGQVLGSDWDAAGEMALNAASRQVDAHCGRRFWQDDTVQTRQYYAENYYECETDDISTVTGLIVKTDTADTGGFDTTLTITTEFLVLPLNAADRVPVWPYTELRLVDVQSFPMSGSGRPGVQVTAKFGWPAVPDDVVKATLIEATQLFKANAAIFGGLSFGDAGFMRVREGLNPMAAALLAPYVKVYT
jgi:hypothetical protein